MAMTNLRENLASTRTRWLTIATLLSALVTLVGVAFTVTAIFAYAAEVEPSPFVQGSAGGFTTVGVVLVVIFAILLTLRTRDRGTKP